MKKLLSVLIISSLLGSSVTTVFATDNQPNAESEDYAALLSEMIQTYDSGEYFSTMSVTIGEPNLVI